MNFLEAAEIAKKLPGSTLVRGASGLFVVKLTDGRTISAPTDLQPSKPAVREGGDGGTASRLLSFERQLHVVEHELRIYARQREIDRKEIDQLRLEVNDLKESIARIPVSEWKRYQEEHERLQREHEVAEAARLVGLARSGKLSYTQLTLVVDNASRLGIDGDDLTFIRNELDRTRPTGAAREWNSFVVFSKTDGQD